MNRSENGVSGSSDKEDEMLVSTLEKKQSQLFRSCDSSPLENHEKTKLPKFALNMKNYCSIHLRLLHNLNEDKRHDIFMLNPEYHLKFLEGNLSFLSRKPSSRSNDFKITSSKSCSYGVETLEKVFSFPEKRLPSLKFTSLSESCVSQFKAAGRDFENGSSGDTVVFDRSKIKESDIPLKKQSLDKPSLTIPPIVKIKEKYNGRKNRSHEFQSTMKIKPLTSGKNVDSLKNKNDPENQFEFTVAGEKIVSFVCSPPASHRPRTKESKSNYIYDSDEESTVSSSKCSLESNSNTSTISSYSKHFKRKDSPLIQEHLMKPNMLLWHPPSTSRNVVSLSQGKAVYSCSSFNQQNKQKSSENCINFFGSMNSMCAISNNGSFKHSHNQETVMFRETALRGCYDIETLLKDIKPPLPVVEKQVNETRETIFSAVRLQRENSSIISDSILSIVDICNSWIKLNAHFERKDFKMFLEIHGIDQTIFGDFAQWQCMSRIFLDKLINVLKTVALDKGPNGIMLSQGGTQITTLQSNLSLKGEDILHKTPGVVQNINTSPTDNQGKRWKQRRFLSEKIDSERLALMNNKHCKSNFTFNSSFQNPLLMNSFNAETVFGQGDNGLNLVQEFSKLNPMISTKHYQSAQGDMSLLLSGCKQLNSSNSGFFDKNISLSNTKCCSVMDETAVGPFKDLCTSVTSLVDVPMSSYFPINIQHTIPTVPPLYNNQLCLLTPNQYQPTFSHCLAKPNPIHCIDSDTGENLIQTCYMKPGHYTPPQKPASFQKTVNNTIPINNIPDMGIPFLYSSPYSNSRQTKNLEFPSYFLQMPMTKENNQNTCSDDTWKTAVSMAGPLRDTMMAERTDDGPNLKVSEEVSLKSHFLLSDNYSQNSSSSNDNLKLNSDSDELSDNNPSKDITAMQSKTKTMDWLIESFGKISLDNNLRPGDILSENEFVEVGQSSEDSTKEKDSYLNSKSLRKITDNINDNNINREHIFNKYDGMLSPLLNNDMGCFQNKQRKNNKSQDEYDIFDQKHSKLDNKPDTMVFTRNMSKKVKCQLEEILNSIWNTKVCALIEEEIKSDKEISKLELKVRSPLHLQAMRCKLSNQSYETLDQALCDFQQYFIDIRSRNKGDKQCMEAIAALERIFFGLVNKHFGLTYIPAPQYLGATKMRRLKKTPRRF